MISALIALALIVFFLYGTVSYVRDKLCYRLPPGPVPLPFIGALYRMHMPWNLKPWKDIFNFSKEYGDIFTFYFGPLRGVMIHGASNIRQAMITQAKSFSGRPYLTFPGSESLPDAMIVSKNESWKGNRRFCANGLKLFGVGKRAIVVNIQNEAEQLVHALNERCNGVVEKSITDLLQNHVLNTIFYLIFGKRLEFSDPDFWAIRNTSQTLFERPVEANGFHMAFPFVTKVHLPPQVTDFQNIATEFERMLLAAMEERKKLPEKHEIEDFIDLYFKSHDSMPFKTFLGISCELVIAGTETTGSLLTWAVLYLCKWPKCQEKCHQTIDKAILSDRMPTIEDRDNLVYVDAVMNETLRFASVAPIPVYRSVQGSDVTLEGYELPEGTVVGYNVWALHHDEEYWKDPNVFRPERWISDEGKLIDHSSHFMPFGIGHRSCVGEQLARVIHYIFTVAMLQRFHFKFPSEDYDVDLDSGKHGITNVPPKFDCIISHREHVHA